VRIFLVVAVLIAAAIWKIKIHIWLLVSAIVLGALSLQSREYLLQHSIITKLALHHAPISIVADIRSDPTLTTPKVVGNNRRAPQITFLVVSRAVISREGRVTLRAPLRVVTPTNVHLIPGDLIEITGQVLPTTEKKVAALFAAKGPIALVQRAPTAQRIAARIRTAFARQAQRIGGDAGPLIPGLVLGDTSLESSQLIAHMRRTGLTHLTAVSGENFAIISSFLLSYLGWLIRPLRGRLIIVALVLASFIVIVRPSPSVLRAAVMSAVLLIARARGQRQLALPSLGLAITVLILVNPFLAIDPGFALSVCATAGILLLSDPIDRKLATRIASEKVRELMVIPLSATLFCLPITVALSGQVSLVAIPANIFASLAVAPITIVGFIASLLAISTPGLTHILLLGMQPFSGWISLVAREFARLPVLQVPHSYWGAGLILLALALRKFWRRILLLLALILLLIQFLNSSWPGGGWLMAICDVGQGDGYAIALSKDQAIVIDAGPDPALMDSCLSRLGIRQIPLLILTHFHADHVGGLTGVMHNRKVGAVWISPDHQPALEYQRALSTIAPIRPIEVMAGEHFTMPSQYGEVAIEILSPSASDPSLASHQTGSEINNSSIAALIAIAGRSIFAAGDIEPVAQADLLQRLHPGPVDILKVAHHGSSHQDLDLERALRPRLAVMSVGAGNPYGHPSLATIAQLRSEGARTYRTDLDGAISIDTSLRIRTLKRDRWKFSWG